MKWAPTLLVLAAFGVLLYVSSKKPEDAAAAVHGKAPSTAAAHEPAPANPEPKATHAPEPQATHTSEPAATHAPAPQATGSTKGEETPAVEVVKAPPAANPAPASRDPNSIVGSVKDAAGEGVAQIVVKLSGGDGKEIRDTRSDGAGRFVFGDVAAGSYTLTTFDPDYLYTARTQKPVATKAGAVTDVELNVDRGRFGIRGTIVDGVGKAIPDKRVTLTAGGAEFSVMTDPKGRFLVSGLAPGDWRVMPDGVARQAKSVKIGSDASVPYGDVELVLERRASVDVTLAGSHLHRAELHGGEAALLRRKTETGEALLRQPLAIEHKPTEGGHHAEEVVGVAHFADLDPGDYEIEIVDPSGTKSLIQFGALWKEPIALTLKEGDVRPVVLPTAQASFGRGVEVPTWIRALMFIGIGLLILATPILFPPPLVPKRPPAKAGAPH